MVLIFPWKRRGFVTAPKTHCDPGVKIHTRASLKLEPAVIRLGRRRLRVERGRVLVCESERAARL